MAQCLAVIAPYGLGLMVVGLMVVGLMVQCPLVIAPYDLHLMVHGFAIGFGFPVGCNALRLLHL